MADPVLFERQFAVREAIRAPLIRLQAAEQIRRAVADGRKMTIAVVQLVELEVEPDDPGRLWCEIGEF
jgi:hypothetical protein